MVWLGTQLHHVMEKAVPYIAQLYDQGILYRDTLKVFVNFMQIVGSFVRHAYTHACTRACSRARARAHACAGTHTHTKRIELNFPSEFKSLMRVFSAAEINIDVPSTACLLSSIGFYDRLLGYTITPFIMLVVMVLPTLWARFRKMEDKADALFNLFLIWSLIFTNLIYPSVPPPPSTTIPPPTTILSPVFTRLVS